MLNLPESKTLQGVLLVCVAAATISSNGLLVKASQVDGVVLYSKFSVTLFSELLKLCFATVVWLHANYSSSNTLVRERHHSAMGKFPTKADVLRYSVPGILYLIVNNIKYPISERVNPGVIAVVWNLKIFGIAVLLKFALGREITVRRWVGVTFLSIGSILTEFSQWDWHNKSGKETNTQLQGLILLATGLIIVSIANVTCEHLYKGNSTDTSIPLHKQNVVLYSWGFTLNAGMWFIQKKVGGLGLLDNYTPWTVAVVISNAMGGYLVGAMFKYLDSIAATFADLIAMLATASLSAIFFDLNVNVWFCVGFIISSLSIYIYYVEKDGSYGNALKERSEMEVPQLTDLSTESIKLIQ